MDPSRCQTQPVSDTNDPCAFRDVLASSEKALRIATNVLVERVADGAVPVSDTNDSCAFRAPSVTLFAERLQALRIDVDDGCEAGSAHRHGGR